MADNISKGGNLGDIFIRMRRGGFLGGRSRLCELEKLKRICCVKLYLLILTAIVMRRETRRKGEVISGAQSIK